MEDPKDLLADGIAALRAGELWHAETFFLEAYQALSGRRQQLGAHEFAYMKAACYGLGRVYRLTGRHELAVTILERALPNPVAFKDLIKAFRHLAESAHAAGDEDARGGWYHRMYSLGKIHRAVSALHSPQQPQVMDWRLGDQWIDDLRAKHGTIYAYRFEGEKLEEDALLTPQDYEGLHACRRLAAAAVIAAMPSNTDPANLFGTSDGEEPPLLEMSALSTFPQDQLEVWPETE